MYFLFISFLFGCLIESFKFLKRQEKWLSVLIVILICWYCACDSFDAMGRSARRAKIFIDFVTAKKTEYQIIDEHYPKIKEKAAISQFEYFA